MTATQAMTNTNNIRHTRNKWQKINTQYVTWTFMIFNTTNTKLKLQKFKIWQNKKLETHSNTLHKSRQDTKHVAPED